jgi:hypothetical protein
MTMNILKSDSYVIDSDKKRHPVRLSKRESNDMSRYSLVNAFLHRGRGEQKKRPRTNGGAWCRFSGSD